jgi:hypothetical protein
MLNLKIGTPIAKIKGGKLDGNFLYIDTDNQSKSNKGNNRDMVLKYGKFEQIPDIVNERQTCFISGPSGSGKSTYCANYIEKYQKLFPKNKIIIFSAKPEDPVLDRLGVSRFIIDESLLTHPIDMIQDLKEGNMLIVFDDCNSIANEKVKQAVTKIMNQILELGRSYKIYCLITTHVTNDGKATKLIWIESHTITIFPQSGNRYSMEYALKHYCGFGKKISDKILNSKSRWVTISKTYPNYILTDNECWIP